MPTVFSLTTVVFHSLLALGMNAAMNWAFHSEGYVAFTIYFVVLAHEHYKMLEKLSKMVIIDQDKLKEIMRQEKIKQLSGEVK